MLALPGDGDSLLSRILQLRSIHFERYLRCLVRVQVVVDDSGKRDRVALRDEPGRFQPHDYIFARDHFVLCRADFGVSRYATRSSTPGGQIIGQVNFDCGLAVCAGDDVWLPEGSVLEVFPDSRLNQVTFILEVGKLVGRFVFGNIDWFVAGETGEGIVN